MTNWYYILKFFQSLFNRKELKAFRKERKVDHLLVGTL